MNHGDLWHFGNWVLYCGILPVLAFTIVFGLRAHWRNSTLGKALLLMGVSQTLIALQIAARLLWTEGYPGFLWVRLAAFTVFAACMWRLFVMLMMLQRRHDIPFEERP